MNNLTISGTIGKDAVLRSAGGTPVVSFSVSVSNGKDKDGNWRESTWFECSLWGEKRATERVAALLSKGMKITVSGSVSLRKWEKDGKSGASLEVRVADFTPMGGGGEKRESGGRSETRQAPRGTDWSNAGPDNFSDDSIPF